MVRGNVTVFVSKIITMPLLLLQPSAVFGLVAYSMLEGNLSKYSLLLVIFMVISHTLIINQYNNESNSYLPIPPFWRKFEMINVPLNFLSSLLLYALGIYALYNKFFV